MAVKPKETGQEAGLNTTLKSFDQKRAEIAAKDDKENVAEEVRILEEERKEAIDKVVSGEKRGDKAIGILTKDAVPGTSPKPVKGIDMRRPPMALLPGDIMHNDHGGGR